MATILSRFRNTVGVRKERYIKFTSAGTTDTIVTGLRWVDYADLVPINTVSPDPNADIFINSASASAVEDDPGTVFLSVIISGDTFVLRAIGK